MIHLGSRISALVDGQLPPAAAERALAHAALCPACAGELAAARAAHAALARAEDVAPAPDLTARLLALSLPASERPGDGPSRGSGSPDPFAPPAWSSELELAAYGPVAAGLTGRARRGALRGELRPRGRGTARLAVGSVAGLGAVAAMLFVLGERPAIVPTSHPGADLGMLGHTVAGGSDGLPDAVGTDGRGNLAAETAAWLRAHRWSFPSELPEGWSVSAVRWSDDQVLEVDVTGPDCSVVVTEQQGRLDTDALAGATEVTVSGRDVYVLSREPWHLAWQSGATVVQVVGSKAVDTTEPLVAAFPRGGFDDGVPARISRGWSTVTGALAGS